MKVLMLVESFPPETKSASTLFFELAESLAGQGHKVSVVTRHPSYYVAEGVAPSSVPGEETVNGVNVFRQRIPHLARNVPFVRGIEHFIIGLMLFRKARKVRGFDLVLVYSPPLPLAVAGLWLAGSRKKPLVVNLHDLYPQSVIELGLLKNKLLIWLSRKMESLLYRKAAYFVVPYESNKQYLIEHGTSEENVEIVPNWADTDNIKPGAKDNEFSRKYGLTDKFVVSFTGAMGFAQGLEVMVQAAGRLKNRPEIKFILVGDGVKKKALRSLAKELKLSNVGFIAPQAPSIYPQVLQASDISLVILNKNFSAPAVPGKLLSIMAAGLPVIASVPLEGESPKIINKFKCGLCVKPGSPDALVEAIIKLYNNRDLRGKMGSAGREAAVNFYSRPIAVSKYEKIFNRLLGAAE